MLKDRFPKLYQLSIQKNSLGVDVGVSIDGTWDWRLNCRRALSFREVGMLADLHVVVGANSLLHSRLIVGSGGQII